MRFPHLTFLYDLYQKESQPFRKVHRMIDLFESIIKTHTAVIISEYVRQNNLSDAAKGLLSQGLRTPSLGTWQLFSRVLFEELEKDQFQWSISHFPEEFAALDKALNNDKTNVIAFRNGYAHGATPSDEACVADIVKFELFLLKLLQSQWLQESSLDVREGKVRLCSISTELSLHPILIFRDEKTEASLAFFNDIKNDKIGLLNYPLGKHYREKDFYQEFLSHLPLNEWKKSGNNEFFQRIEELTESFKGRTIERKRLLDFVVEKNKGYFSIQGNPGIGKSALIAQFFKDLKGFKEAQNFSIVEYFIRRGTQQAQAEYLFQYLIKRTDELFPQGREIRAEGKLIFDLQYQLFSKWRQWNEHSQGKKLIFLIDGLDEGTEANVPVYLPRENFENVLIIYGSRPGGHKSIDDLWGTLPPEQHEKLELTGLGKEDIRALIYEVANKYEVERDSLWIDAVQQRSQGNPLYLKLLCDAIENNGIALNDVQALPSKIDEYYKAILLRYANDVDGEALLSGLFTFAAAKDYLTMSHLGLINGIGSATLMRIGSTLKEVLYENPLTEEVLDYQLFHESFREYLVKEHAREVSEAQQRIIAFCAGWKELKGDWEQRYALEHYAAHLHESAKEQHGETLLKLMYDTEYQATQKKVLRGFEATNALFRLSLLKASDVKRYDDQLEAALCLVDLKYEEANDAPQIVAMVAAGEIDLALKRIESFGGADKEGLQRKFILYMLCLMELTLLESKDKPFRKDAIEKLLNHLDEQLPTDHSVLNWNDFFPVKIVLSLAFELDLSDLDWRILFKKGKYDHNWLNWFDLDAPNGLFELEVYKFVIESQSENYNFYQREFLINHLKKLNLKSQAIAQLNDCVQLILSFGHYSFTDSYLHDELTKIVIHFFDIGDWSRALECMSKILNEGSKSAAIIAICKRINEFCKEDAFSVLDEINKLSNDLQDNGYRGESQKELALAFLKLGEVDFAFSIARSINTNFWKSKTLAEMVVFSQAKSIFIDNRSIYLEAIGYARLVTMPYYRSNAISFIIGLDAIWCDELINEVLLCVELEEIIFYRCNILLELAKNLSQVKFHSKAIEILEIVIPLAAQIDDYFLPGEKLKRTVAVKGYFRRRIQCFIAIAFIKNEAVHRAIELFDEIEISDGLLVFLEMAIFDLAEKGDFDNALKLIQKLENGERVVLLNKISKELLRQEMKYYSDLFLNEALTSIESISSYPQRIDLAIQSAILLIKKSRVIYAAKFILDLIEKCGKQFLLSRECKSILGDLAIIFIQCGENVASNNLVFLLLESRFEFESGEYVSKGKSVLFRRLFLSGRRQEAFDFIHAHSNDKKMLNELKKNIEDCIKNEDYEITFNYIFSFYCDLKDYKREEIELVLHVLRSSKQIALVERAIADIILTDSNEIISIFLSKISTIYYELNCFFEANDCLIRAQEMANQIENKEARFYVFQTLSREMAFQGHFKDALKLIDCIEFGNIDIYKGDIAKEIYRQGDIELFFKTISELDDEDKFFFLSEFIVETYNKDANCLTEFQIKLIEQVKDDYSLSIIYLKLAVKAKEDYNFNFAIELEEKASHVVWMELIPRDTARDFEYKQISKLYLQLGNYEYGVMVVKFIDKRSNDKIEAIQFLLKTMSQDEKWIDLEIVTLEIEDTLQQHRCLYAVAESVYERQGFLSSLLTANVFNNSDVRLHYLKGWTMALKENEADKDCLQIALRMLAHDSDSIEILLHKYAAHAILIEENNPNLERLNRTLEIQWALDLACTYLISKNNIVQSSTNLIEWLHEIADEDDREQIELWAKQVAKGKITEEEFEIRIKDLN